MNLKLDLTTAHAAFDLHPVKAGISLTAPSHLKALKSEADSVDKSLKGKTPLTADAAASKAEVKTKKACQDFEAVFLNFMLSQMRESVPKSDLMGKDPGESTFQGMMDEELSHQMAAGGGIGLGDMIYRQMTVHGPKIAADKTNGNAVTTDITGTAPAPQPAKVTP